MSVDLKSGAVSPEVQAFLDAFDRLSDAAKRDALGRLPRESQPASEPAPTPSDPEAAAVAAGDRALRVAEAFDAIDREEEAFARGGRSRPR